MPDIAVTFDDGYLSHFRTAQILKALGVRATFFLVTGLSEWNGEPLLTRRPLLIKEISRMGHEIGSHTVSHPNMTTLGDERAAQELVESKRSLEELTSAEIQGFAYPYGRFDESTRELVSRYYKYARAAQDSGTGIFDRYSIGVKHAGRNLAYCSMLRPGDTVSNRMGYVLLFHSMPERFLLIWIRYLQSLGARFVTLRQLVAIWAKLPTRRGVQVKN